MLLYLFYPLCKSRGRISPGGPKAGVFSTADSRRASKTVLDTAEGDYVHTVGAENGSDKNRSSDDSER